jgi:hypothetical protein
MNGLKSQKNYVVQAHPSDEFNSFDPDRQDIFEEEDKDEDLIEITEQALPDGYVEDEDEDFEVNESELESESSYLTSSEEEEQLDKNGKRGECEATPDDSEENDEEEELLDKNCKRGECGATPDERE